MKKFLILLATLFIGIVAAHADTANITWLNEDHTTYDTSTCTVGGDIILPTTPTKRGYTFRGWIPDYTELEYIASTGTQYIDTGVGPGDYLDTRIEMKAAYSTNNVEKIFGVIVNESAQYALYSTGSQFTYSLRANNAGDVIGTTLNFGAGIPLPLEFVISGKNVTVNGTTTTIGFSGTVNTSESIYLFSWHRVGYSESINDYSKSKIYFFRMYKSGTLIRDFIPVLDYNNVPCMYDKVSGTFFYNAGTGNFVAGPVK